MGFVFLAVGALSAAALGSVVRARRSAARHQDNAVQTPVQAPLPVTPHTVEPSTPSVTTQETRVGAATNTTASAAGTQSARSTHAPSNRPAQTAHTNSSSDATAAHSGGDAGGARVATHSGTATTPANPQGERSFDQL